MASSKTLLVALSVDGNVLLVSALRGVRQNNSSEETKPKAMSSKSTAASGRWASVTCLELLDRGLNDLHATLGTHLLGGEVGVETSTVPVTGHGLGVPGDLGTEVLGNTGKQETSQPQVVTHLDTQAGANLELYSRLLANRCDADTKSEGSS